MAEFSLFLLVPMEVQTYIAEAWTTYHLWQAPCIVCDLILIKYCSKNLLFRLIMLFRRLFIIRNYFHVNLRREF
jgi:hypothetical protein